MSEKYDILVDYMFSYEHRIVAENVDEADMKIELLMNEEEENSNLYVISNGKVLGSPWPSIGDINDVIEDEDASEQPEESKYVRMLMDLLADVTEIFATRQVYVLTDENIERNVDELRAYLDKTRYNLLSIVSQMKNDKEKLERNDV